MARHGGFKSEKRKKETARLKKQEEKRQRRFGSKGQQDDPEITITEGQEMPSAQSNEKEASETSETDANLVQKINEIKNG